MFLTKSKIFYGWFVVAGGSLITFGVAGSQFSFGVFLEPMTDEFEWSRATLSLAFGVTFLLSGLLRPAAGYLADHYSPRIVALSGLALTGVMLLLLPFISNLVHLYLIFGVMAIGITLGTGTTLTKIVSAWFYTNRGVTLGLIMGGGSAGAMVLVPASSIFLVLFDWQEAYLFLGLLLLVLVLPIAYATIRDRPEDVGAEPYGSPGNLAETDPDTGSSGDPRDLVRQDSTFAEAVRSAVFWRLTFGYFV